MQNKEFEIEQQYLNNVENAISEQICEINKFVEVQNKKIDQDKENFRDLRSTEFDAQERDQMFEDIENRVNDINTKLAYANSINRIKNNPYFGRVDLVENGSNKVLKNYVGFRNIQNEKQQYLVLDWRAPIASMFYDYDKGPYSYKTSSGVIKGEIINKRQYRIRNAKLEYYFDSDIKVDDELLQEALSGNAGTKMQNIVETIQKEQNEVIRCDENKNIVVLGVAGSGKTSIALHRVAYILYKMRGKISHNEILILSPNNVFSSYISSVLPDLGEENVIETTFDNIISEELNSEYKIESKMEQIERIMNNESEVADFEEKVSYDFFENMLNYLYQFVNINFKPKDITLGNVVIKDSYIKYRFFKSYSNQKPSVRIRYILNDIVEDNFKNVGNLLPDIEEFLNAKLYRMFKQNNIYNIYSEFLKSINKKFIFANHKIKNEDAQSLLLIKDFLYGTNVRSNFKHLIIDEMQDYSATALYMINNLFNCPKTILGDIAQSVDSEISKQTFAELNKLIGNDYEFVKLTKSYRSAYEITKLANTIIKRKNVEFVNKNESIPSLLKCEDIEHLEKSLTTKIEEFEKNGCKTIAVLTKSFKKAKEVYNLLKQANVDVTLVNDDCTEYNSKVMVLSIYQSKGLEFDGVIVYNTNAKNFKNKIDKQLLYIGVTRALKQVCLVYTVKPTKFVLKYFNEN